MRGFENLPKPGKPVGAIEYALLYTSNDVRSKGCLLSNFYFLNVGRRYLDEGGLARCAWARRRLITPLPFFHMNALAVSTTAMILSGGCLVQLDRFHPRTWWRDVAASRATIVQLLGVMPAVLLGLPGREPRPQRALRLRRERQLPRITQRSKRASAFHSSKPGR